MSKSKSSMILGLQILLTIIATIRSESNITDTDAQIYLSKFGYLTTFDSNSSHAGLVAENRYTKAIEDLQKFAGLNDTGELDEETKKLKSLLRCGVPDKAFHTSNRSKRYTIACGHWKSKDLTYKILYYPDNLTATDVDAEIARAFALWSEHIDLTFTPKKTGDVDILIKFVSGYHFDDLPFDGMHGVLAHAYDPMHCGVHFDADEWWTINSTFGTNLLENAAHEFGHVLGLAHSNRKSSVMSRVFYEYNPNFKLDHDDILAIQKIYGKKTSQKTSSISPTSTTPKSIVDLPSFRPNKGLCNDIKIDAIFRSDEGQTYVFMGENYYELSEELKAHGNPKLISEGWPGLPGNIDAAFMYLEGRTYFFKGTQCWRYHGRQLDDGFPKKINEVFEGIPDHLDAAMIWGIDRVVYFFKGNQLWQFDQRKNPKTVTSYIIFKRNWERVPPNLDAAIQHRDGNTYFFKDNKFYKVNDKRESFSIYLSKFGYLTTFDSNSSHAGLVAENRYTKAIEDLQKFAGLNDTGELDEETKKLKSLLRCGVPDKAFHTSNRSKRYTIACGHWKSKDLTYKILYYPDNLTATDVDAEIARAFALWSEHIDLTFTPKKTGDVDILIKFVSGYHFDDLPFDGMHGVLAHAYDPMHCGVHFDADEWWTINSTFGTNLLENAAHEFGHVLGLAHSNRKSSVMSRVFYEYNPNFKLDHDDILAIQKIYGKKTSQKTSSISPTSTTPKSIVDLPSFRPNKGLCNDIKIDAIFRSDEGQTYVFMGENYYELSEELKAHGNPKLISEGWPGLPGNIDAAFMYLEGRTYFFKGTQCWRYHGRQLDDGFPKKINEVFEGIPDHLDAAMIWGIDRVVYFFKGNQLWQFDQRKNPKTVTSYIIFKRNWERVPPNLDAAIQHRDGNTYFFKDNKFYKVNDKRESFSTHTYDTAIWMFGC